MIDVRMYTVGQVQENCYVVREQGADRAVIVDPGDEAERILEGVKALGITTVEAILLTHTHFDHIGAVAPVAKATGAPVYCPELETQVLANIMDYVPWPGFGPFESYEADHTVKGGETLSFAGLEFEVTFTPGHSPGHVSYAATAENALFSGDVLARRRRGAHRRCHGGPGSSSRLEPFRGQLLCARSRRNGFDARSAPSVVIPMWPA